MNKVFVGINQKGFTVYASQALIAQYGLQNVKKNLGIPIKMFPVKTGLGEHSTVMVEADSHEDAVNRYIRGKK